jgi:hypothetical protein
MWSKVGGVAVGSAAIVLSGWSSAASAAAKSAPPRPPVQTALAWFRAIDAKNAPKAESYFTPRQRNLTEWVTGYVSKGKPFTDVHCRSEGQKASTANVYCTFVEAPSPDRGNPDTFWTISMQKSSGGHWLIDSYGQG